MPFGSAENAIFPILAHVASSARRMGHGTGPVCRTIVTVLPAGATSPALGDWLNTQDLVWFTPTNFGTSPADRIICAAAVAGSSRTLGTLGSTTVGNGPIFTRLRPAKATYKAGSLGFETQS
jgi:hypothetical protein